MKIAGRYEVNAKLGQGGMGVVYRAYDPAPMDREVAVKTLHEFMDPLALDLFYKECRALKSISHPNIVEIFDIGEFEEAGQKKPYFVMPLLPGHTLDELIRNSSHRLTVERVVEIISQTCRGLQAAHERGLVHRDLKPSNIFVMADDSVKLIDFGVAHAVSARSQTTGFDKGTLLYMAPEQVQHKPVSPQSDVYALGLTAYEALTRRQPFRGATEQEVVQAILTRIPQPASDLNPTVSHLVSRAVHKAMAKQPWNRYDTAREFGETLQKALRNEPIAMFDPTRTQPRIRTASKALEKGDYQFASEIVSELESEGNLDPQITMLRAQIDQMARKKTLAQLLESARARYEEEEDPLALQKIHEVLQLDPTNVAALGLKARIEDRRSERQFENWISLARQHVDNHSYTHAHEALQNAVALRPKDSRVLRLSKEVESAEQEYVRLRREKSNLYESAVNAWKNGDVGRALSQMKHVLELDARAPDATSTASNAGVYQSFYDRIRSEHDAINSGYAEARRHLSDGAFDKALETCDAFLDKYPGHSLFQALKIDIEEQQRQHLSSFIADVNRRLEGEPDLDAKLHLVREAAAAYPEEAHFARLIKTLEDKRDLVNSLVERARVHEAGGQFAEALTDLDTLQTIYGSYPGLGFERDRLRRRQEQSAREAARVRWAAQVEQQIDSGDYTRALELLDKAQEEYPDDARLTEFRKVATESLERIARAEGLMAEGNRLYADGQFDAGIDALRSALQLDDRSLIRLTLRDLLVARAQALLEDDWAASLKCADSALEVDPNHALAKSLRARALDKKQDGIVSAYSTRARGLLVTGDIAGASREVQQALTEYPVDDRLLKLQREIQTDFTDTVIPSSGSKPASSEASRNRPAAAPPPPPHTPPPPPSVPSFRIEPDDTLGETVLRPDETVLRPAETMLKPVTGARAQTGHAPTVAVPTPVATIDPAPAPAKRPAPAPTPTMHRPADAPTMIPAPKQREPFALGGLVWLSAAVVVVIGLAVGAYLWTSGSPDNPATVAQEVSPPVAPVNPEPTPVVPPRVSDSTPLPQAPEPAPPPVIAQTPQPSLPAVPAPVPAPSPRRPTTVAAAPAPVTNPAPDAAPPPQVVTTPPAPVPAPVRPAPIPAPVNPAPAPVEPTPPAVPASVRAAQMMDLASQSEKKRDWPAALQNYENARDLDPSLNSVAGVAIARIQATMLQEGADAFKRARQYDALNRVDDAIAWYERAARNLPDSSPDKRIAADRLRALKQAR